jgi:PmbA protein
MDETLIRLAEQTINYARAQGAAEAAVGVSRARFVDLKQREGKVETLQASTSRGLSLSLYVDGRYSSNSTSMLEPDELRAFVDRSLAMTRRLAADPYRALPDPELYGPTPGVELDLCDPSYDALDMDRRRDLVASVEHAALEGGDDVLSVTAEMVTQSSDSLQIHSNGFRGERRATSYMLGASVTARDAEGRRPEDSWWAVARHLEDLPDEARVGQEAMRRAVGRVGSRKAPSKQMPIVVENRAASRLISSLLGPLSGAALQQQRSCFDGRLGERITAPVLTITDDPLLPRGLGSRTFDGEGLAARQLPVISDGQLESYFIDVYYGRKLGWQPTTGSTSNLVIQPGARALDQLLGDLDEAILLTAFLGGNANPATGDFSFGIAGFLVRAGVIERPISEMNITGSHQTLWHDLREVGADIFPYSSIRTPSLVFDDVQVSGL